MTDDAINAAIAQACGWEHRKGFRWQNPEGLAMFEWDIPNYCTDLNAMHQAEQALWRKDYNLRFDYLHELGQMLNKSAWRRMEAADMLDLTARERAEAFLRTLGKWEEVQP